MFRIPIIVAAFSLALSAQEVIVLASGNGLAGGQDSQVHMLVGPVNGPFPNVFTLTDFLAAQTGSFAEIPIPAVGWNPTLPGPGSAQWITTSQVGASMGTALYAIDFTVVSSTIVQATLDVNFYVDDFFGDNSNEGLFVNTFPVPNTRPPLTAPWAIANTMAGLDITPFILAGQNTLFLYGHDNLGAGGLCFRATITIYDAATISVASTFTVGGTGVILLSGGPGHLGDPYLLAPAITPPASPGSGIPLPTGSWFRLSLTDPLLNFALFGPPTPFFPALQGTLSPVNGDAVSPVFLPNDPSLAGQQIWFQGLVLAPALEATNVATVTVQ